MTRTEAIARYRGIEAFYAADPRRRHSDEADFGVLWRDGIATATYWRVSWVEITGEVYAAELRPAGLVVVLAERLRRPVVERALANREGEYSLTWAWSGVALPRVPPQWSGYVAAAGSPTVWAVENGWWERALPLSATAEWRSAAGRRQADLASRVLAEAILVDHLGGGVDGPVAGSAVLQFHLDVIAPRIGRMPLRLPMSDVAAWVDAAGGLTDVGERKSA